jgi:hypothetical protein
VLFASTLDWTQKAAAKTNIAAATAKLAFLRILASDWGSQKIIGRAWMLRRLGSMRCDLDHSS